MVVLVKKKRFTHETVRPAINLSIKVWNDFSILHRTSQERSLVIEKLMLLQIDDNIVTVDTET